MCARREPLAGAVVPAAGAALVAVLLVVGADAPDVAVVDANMPPDVVCACEVAADVPNRLLVAGADVVFAEPKRPPLDPAAGAALVAVLLVLPSADELGVAALDPNSPPEVAVCACEVAVDLANRLLVTGADVVVVEPKGPPVGPAVVVGV